MRCFDVDREVERPVLEWQLQRMATNEGEVGHGRIVFPAERDRVGREVEPNQLSLRRQVSSPVTKAAATPAADL